MYRVISIGVEILIGNRITSVAELCYRSFPKESLIEALQNDQLVYNFPSIQSTSIESVTNHLHCKFSIEKSSFTSKKADLNINLLIEHCV